MSSPRITIKDIADKAGVSRGTVDRVLHNRGKVAEPVRAKVNAAIAALRYKPNLVARSLATKKVFTIATLLPNPSEDPFWALPQKGIGHAMSEIEDFGIQLNQFHFSLFDSNSFVQNASKMLESKPDAVLMATEFYLQASQFFQEAHQLDIPILCINTQISEYPTLGYIGQDSFQSGVLAGKLFDITCPTLENLLVLNIGAKSLDQKHLLHKEQGLHYYFDSAKRKVDITEMDFVDLEDVKGLKEKINDHFRNHRTQGIFITNSRAYHLMPVLEEIGIHNICIIGFDLLPQNITYLKEGKIDFLINQDPEKQGELGIKSIFNYLLNNKQPDQIQYLPLDIVMKENYEAYMV